MSFQLQTVAIPRRPAPNGAAASPGPGRAEGRGLVRGLTGNDAVAWAVGQANPHVAAAYPITPQTELMHRLAELAAAGRIETRLIAVESEHSAMSAVLAASAAGCRTFTATSANGLAHMMEVYLNAAALRLPVVMALVNRHLGGLLSIHNDHSDAMLARNAAWLQLHAENAQEAYDNALQAFRLAEDPRIGLPVTICHDGFVVSHTLERVLVLEDEPAREFVGLFVPTVDLLDVENPRGVGATLLPEHAPRVYAHISQAMRQAPAVIEEVGREYGDLTGRPYGLLEAYRMEDAELAIVAVGSVCGTIRAAVDQLRGGGLAVGMVKLRVVRPFPGRALAAAVCGPRLKALAVLDRCVELGSGGPLFCEATSALALATAGHRMPLPIMLNVVGGVGGHDLTIGHVEAVVGELARAASTGHQPLGDPVRFLDLAAADEPEAFSPPAARNARPSGTHEVVMLARGGQGAKTGVYLLAQMMIEEGKYALGLPAEGPERTGAPLKAYARLSESPIEDRQPVSTPDVALVFDEVLLEVFQDELARLAGDAVILVNTLLSPREVRERTGLKGGRVYCIDATGLAMSEFGLNRPNTALIGAAIEILGLCDQQRFGEVFAARMGQLSPKLIQGNQRVIQRAAAECRGE